MHRFLFLFVWLCAVYATPPPPPRTARKSLNPVAASFVSTASNGGGRGNYPSSPSSAGNVPSSPQTTGNVPSSRSSAGNVPSSPQTTGNVPSSSQAAASGSSQDGKFQSSPQAAAGNVPSSSQAAASGSSSVPHSAGTNPSHRAPNFLLQAMMVANHGRLDLNALVHFDSMYPRSLHKTFKLPVLDAAVEEAKQMVRVSIHVVNAFLF
jgi:hypothetical protein